MSRRRRRHTISTQELALLAYISWFVIVALFVLMVLTQR